MIIQLLMYFYGQIFQSVETPGVFAGLHVKHLIYYYNIIHS